MEKTIMTNEITLMDLCRYTMRKAMCDEGEEEDG